MKRKLSKLFSIILVLCFIFLPVSNVKALSYTPIKIGETKNLKVDKSMGIAAYESSNPYVLSINQKGIAKAKNLGFAVVTITTSKGIYQQTFKVVKNHPSIVVEDMIDVDAPKVKLNKTKLYMSTADKATLKVLNTKKTVKWSSSNKSVAKVSSKGVVTPQWFGTAIITARVGNKTLKCTVKVLQEDYWFNDYDKNLSEKENFYTVSIMKISSKKYRIKLSTVNSKGKSISTQFYGDYVDGAIMFTNKGTYKLTGAIKVNNEEPYCIVVVEGNSKFDISTIFWQKWETT